MPLPDAALVFLRSLPRLAGTDPVFRAPRGGALADMTLAAVMRRIGVGAVPHGFRSAFRDWCGERTNYPLEVAEMALAHAIGDRVEAACRRGDLFEKRAAMVSEWAALLATPQASAAVIPMQSVRARSAHGDERRPVVTEDAIDTHGVGCS